MKTDLSFLSYQHAIWNIQNRGRATGKLYNLFRVVVPLFQPVKPVLSVVVKEQTTASVVNLTDKKILFILI